MEELTSHVHLPILALEMEVVWLLELDFPYKILNSFNSIPLVSMDLDAL
jgi:hypothetical protein